MCLQNTWVAENLITLVTGELLFTMHVQVIMMGTRGFKPFSAYGTS